MNPRDGVWHSRGMCGHAELHHRERCCSGLVHHVGVTGSWLQQGVVRVTAAPSMCLLGILFVVYQPTIMWLLG